MGLSDTAGASCSQVVRRVARLDRHLLQGAKGCPALLKRRLMLGRRGGLCCCEVAVQQPSHCSAC